MLRSIGLFLIVCALYTLTLAPTYLWSDSSKLALLVHEKAFFSTGLTTHPGHTLWGYLFSFLPLPFAYTQNWMSAFFGACSVVLIYWILRDRIDDVLAWICSMAAGVSHVFWHYSVINETYSLHAFYLLLVLYLCIRASRRPELLYAAAFVAGLGYANHASIVLVIPGCVALLWNREVFRFVASFRLPLICLLAFTGAAQVLMIPLFLQQNAFDSFTGDIVGVVQVFWVGAMKLFTEAVRYPLYLLYQFPTIGVPIGIWGLIRIYKQDRRFFVATLLIFTAFVLFSFQYFLQRQFPMMIPSFLIFSLWIGEGAPGIVRLLEKKCRRQIVLAILLIILCIFPPIVYYGVYRVAESKEWEFSFVRRLAYRNTVRYFLFPPKNMEYGAEKYVLDAFRQAEPGSMILADFNPAMALVYAQKVLNQRPDLSIILIDCWIFSPTFETKMMNFLRQNTSKGHEIYLADNWEPYYLVSKIEREFSVRQTGGPLWQVLPKRLNSQ